MPLLTLAHLLKVTLFAANLASVGYPLVRSLEAVKSPGQHDDSLWLSFWIVYSTLTLLESILAPVLAYVPGYSVLRLGFLAWLAAPQFKGALFISKELLEPVYDLIFKPDAGLKPAETMASSGKPSAGAQQPDLLSGFSPQGESAVEESGATPPVPEIQLTGDGQREVVGEEGGMGAEGEEAAELEAEMTDAFAQLQQVGHQLSQELDISAQVLQASIDEDEQALNGPVVAAQQADAPSPGVQQQMGVEALTPPVVEAPPPEAAVSADADTGYLADLMADADGQAEQPDDLLHAVAGLGDGPGRGAAAAGQM